MKSLGKIQLNENGEFIYTPANKVTVNETALENDIEFVDEGWINTGLNGICTKEELLDKINEYKGAYQTSLLPFTMKEFSFFCNPNHDPNKKKINNPAKPKNT